MRCCRLRYRLPFFLLLSLAGIVLVLGFGNGVWLVGIGLVLIGICHLPDRASLAGRAAARRRRLVLALQRAEWLPAPWSDAIWPILGSMFMFRLIVYLYDLRHEKTPPTLVRTLAYFFMLPNACFPLFPVVDYKTFRRNYFDADAYQIYQTGVDWMVRGVIHLLLYRFVYYYLTLAPSEVHGPGDLGAVPGLQFPALPARVRTVPSLVGMLLSVRVPPARDAPPLPARVELHRLLAPDQHLLEGLHAEGLLLSGVFPAAKCWDRRRRWSSRRCSCSC